MTAKKQSGKAVTAQSIRRAVAGSTAIETGQSIEELEKRLKARKSPAKAKLAS